MKIVLVGSKEYLALSTRFFFKEMGHEVLLVHRNPKGEGEISFDEMEQGALSNQDVVINFPEKYLLDHKKGTEFYKNEFIETRIKPTLRVKEALLKAENPPKVWISFSSVAYYPKDTERFYKESETLGKDQTANLVKGWEDAAFLGQKAQIRSLILRVGVILSRKMGILKEVMPLYRIGFGSIIGEGTEAFPWIYLKDLFWLLLYFMEHPDTEGAYNVVAPQLIDSKGFCRALAQVMHKRICLRLPRSYFKKKLGDVAEIVYAKSKVYPSRILKTGFGFRYPAIYPALVDALSKDRES